MPLNIFDLQRMQDIQISDTGLREEYISEYQDGAINTAHNLVANNPQLKSKVLTASAINAYTQAIMALENNFYDGVVSVLEILGEKFQVEVDKIIYLENWEPEKSYEVGNFVLYDNEIYLCVQDGVFDINNTLGWAQLIGLRGLEGVTGTDVYYVGTYDSTFTYQPKQLVTYNNQIYVSKTVNTSKYPEDNPDDWLQILEVKPRGIEVSITPPEDIYPGRFWWQQYDMEE